MTKKRFRKLFRAALTRCHEINLAAGAELTYKPGNMCQRVPVLGPGVSYETLWAVIDGVLPVTVGR